MFEEPMKRDVTSGHGPISVTAYMYGNSLVHLKYNNTCCLYVYCLYNCLYITTLDHCLS